MGRVVESDRSRHEDRRRGGHGVSDPPRREGDRSRVYRKSVEDDENQQRQLNIHIDPDVMAGVYSNFANISFSDYEFTLTFARIDHEVEEGDVPGVVVARVNMSTRFMHELLDAMNDAYSKWSSRENIRNLPETTDRGGDEGSEGA